MQRQEAEQIARALVANVGRSHLEFYEDRIHEATAIALHLRRPATPAEEAMIDGARDTRCDHRPQRPADAPVDPARHPRMVKGKDDP